jgi:hypothetical protein
MDRDATQIDVCRGPRLTRRFSKTVLGLGMVLGAVPAQKLLPSSGVEAVVIGPNVLFEPARSTLDPMRVVVWAFHSHCKPPLRPADG